MVGLGFPLKPALLMLMAAALFVATSPAASAHPNVIPTIGIGPADFYPGGVAVNMNTNRIYTANGGSDSVSVIDGDTNTVVATVPVGNLPFSVAVNMNTNRIYTANDGSNNVSVIDGDTNTVVATVPVGYLPHGVAVNPNTNRIYTANRGSDNVSVIDGDTNTVVATVPVGSWPTGVAVNPTTNRIYAANDGKTVSVIQFFPAPFAVSTPISTNTYTPTITFTPTPTETPEGDARSHQTLAIFAVAGGVVLLAAGAWYTRRRWLGRR